MKGVETDACGDRIGAAAPGGAGSRTDDENGAKVTLRRLGSALPYALMAGFVLAMLLWFPFRYRFEFDTDEGFQLMKAFLYSRGHPLGEIFSDHPPLFTVVLAGAFGLFEPSVMVGRLFVLGLACLLLISSAVFMHMHFGAPTAVLAVILLATLPYFAQLSVSVMIGLPAIGLAASSLLAMGIWRRSDRMMWLVVSAIALALSTLTKVFTLVLVPVLIGGLLYPGTAPGEPTRAPARRWLAAVLWGGVLIGIEACGLALVGPGNLSRLVETHSAAQRMVFEGGESALHFGTHWPVLALAFVGGALILVRRSWPGSCILGWFVIGLVSLMLSRPAWYHQQLLASVPAAMLASVAIVDTLLFIRDPWRRRSAALWSKVGAISVLVLTGLLSIGIVDRLQEFDLGWPNLRSDGQLESREYVVLATMTKSDQEQGIMVTDSPMYAFRSLREIPPELAVFSAKRLATGWLTEAEVIEAIKEKRPKLVLLARFPLPKVEEYLKVGYSRGYTHKMIRLYVREGDGPEHEG